MLNHDDWMALADEEYRRLLEVFRSVQPDEWHRATDCTEWDVQALLSHLAGAADSTARVPELLRQAWKGKRRYPRSILIDSINDVQVAERKGRTPAELIMEFEDAARRGVRARTRLPALVRGLVLPIGAPIGTKPLGYLMDRIYTRDAWVHRMDLTRALGREMLVTADHDGKLVADIVDEWMRLHGRPCDLTLTGPAGLHRVSGVGGAEIAMDAIEFARTLSGRAQGADLLAVGVPF